MMQLNVSKRTMMRLIREHKDQIGVPVPKPNCKEVRFEFVGGDYKVSWQSEGAFYTFTLTARLHLLAHIYSVPGMCYTQKSIPLDRDWLIGLGILVEGEEGFECQG